MGNTPSSGPPKEKKEESRRDDQLRPHERRYAGTCSGILDMPFQTLAFLLQHQCETCKPPDQHSDNDRMPMTFEMSDMSAPKTPLDALEHHRGKTMNFFCEGCREKLLEIPLTPNTTAALLQQKLSAIVNHDPTMSPFYMPGSGIPQDARVCCMLAKDLKVEELLTPKLLAEIEVSLSAGELGEKLSEKMVDAHTDHQDETKCCIRIGLGHREADSAILELWRAGHSSPRRLYGGSAGSFRVVHGRFDMKLYRFLESTDPIEIHHVTGRRGLIEMQASDTTWMNRENWYVHELASPEDNPMGFALLLRVHSDPRIREYVSRMPVDKSIVEIDYFLSIDKLHPSDRRDVPDFRETLQKTVHHVAAAAAWCKHARHVPTSQSSDEWKRMCYQKSLDCKQFAAAWFGLGLLGGATVNEEFCPRINCYQNALECDKTYAAAWINMGIDEGGGRFDGVFYNERMCYEEAIKNDERYPNGPTAWSRLGDVIESGLNGGFTCTSKECYVKALELFQPKAPRREYAHAWFCLGNAGGGEVGRKVHDPRCCYQKALDCDKTYIEAWTHLGCTGGGEVAFAVDRKAAPGTLGAESQEVATEKRTFNPKQCFVQGIKIDSDAPDPWIELGILGGADPGMVEERDRGYTSKGCYMKAVEKSEPGKPVYARGWLGLGNIGEEVRLKDRTYRRKDCYRQALECDMNCQVAWINYGIAGGGPVGHHVYSTRACFERAVDICKSAETLTYLGKAEGGKVGGKSQTAKECYAAAVDLNKDYYQAWLGLAETLERSSHATVNGQRHTALTCSIRALELNDQDPFVFLYLGINGGGKGFTKKDCFEQALKRDSNCAPAWKELGTLGGGKIGGRNYSRFECLRNAKKISPQLVQGPYGGVSSKLAHLCCRGLPGDG